MLKGRNSDHLRQQRNSGHSGPNNPENFCSSISIQELEKSIQVQILHVNSPQIKREDCPWSASFFRNRFDNRGGTFYVHIKKRCKH